MAEYTVVTSIGSKGDSLDKAIAEALDSVYKAEPIDRHVWSGHVGVMAETSRRVG
ncbi:hypothetical protein GCM10010038_04710 [Glutamicibacter protophormiae]|nr:hypothetical protein GCM10010038_04710 [Glutamicibacter protophormiae]